MFDSNLTVDSLNSSDEKEISVNNQPSATPGIQGKQKKRRPPDLIRTHRFDLTLEASEVAQGYCEFNWLDLVAQEESLRINKRREKMKSELEKSKGNLIGAINPLVADDDEQLKEIAKSFELKYGCNLEKIKSRKQEILYKESKDLGYGYDSDDSFIDNSEALDEAIPSNYTTSLGGFYINTGDLKLIKKETCDELPEVVVDESNKKKPKQKRKKFQDANNENTMSRSETATIQSTKPQASIKQKAKSRKRTPDESGAGPKKQRQKKAVESKTMKKAPNAGKSGPKLQETGVVSDKTNSILITVTK